MCPLTNCQERISVCSIWSHLVPKVGQEGSRPVRTVCRTHSIGQFSLILFSNSLFLHSKTDILKKITSLQYHLQPGNHLRHLPKQKANCAVFNAASFFFFWILSFHHRHVLHPEVEGKAWGVFLISLSLQLSAAYRPILHCKGSLQASAKKLITVLKSNPVRLPRHYNVCFSPHMPCCVNPYLKCMLLSLSCIASPCSPVRVMPDWQGLSLLK